jgi:RHS repeat-associated protein
MGEKFTANPVTGTGSLAVPISTSPGRSGFSPQLSLSYDSGIGNGPFGFGWSLALPSITRKTEKGLPQYMDAGEADTFILSGAEDLVPLLVENNGQWIRDVFPPRTVYDKQYSIHRYRPRIEGLFARIERWVNLLDPQDTFWRSISQDNIATWYGKTAESRIADPTNPAHIFTWLICESSDDRGNIIVYQYKPENSDGVDLFQAHERNRSDTSRSANRYLKRVLYGSRTPYFPDLTASVPVALPIDWHFELVFDYGEHDQSAPVPQETGTPWACRVDPFSTYRATFEVRTYRVCQRALLFHHFANEPGVGLNCLVQSTTFTYSQPAHPSADPTKPCYSFLLSVTRAGYRRESNGGYLSKALPPLEFAYTEATIDETVRDIDAQSLENLPYGLDGAHYQWIDLDGEGLSGILAEQAGSWFYKPNISPANPHSENGVPLAQFGPMQVVARQPSLAALQAGRQHLLDLAGDGHLDLVQFDGPTPGFFTRTEEESWESFTPFASLPQLNWQNPNLKFVDLTGDGHADLLISEDDAFWWHTSLAAAGFGPAQRVPQALDEEQGPKLVFADGSESIFLADLCGDGLTDLVRIRNGEVCYWPNLGYGRFGSRVTMDQAPWFEAPGLFDGRRIRLADIDGSGTADILYLASGGVHLYFNHSGNAWSERRVLSQFPPVESVSSATVLDLHGNGTACLVWSSPLPAHVRRPMCYLDLMGGQKPYLLIQMTNNLGAETRIQYAPSTRFYVTDRLAGTPWLTRIPFPVHVVERVETYDHVNRNRFVTRYAYHHGYYDRVEREFRGFGRVDQWDTEEFATLTDSGTFPQATNIDAASHMPPVWTRTWFHTGAYFGEARISQHLKQEYYREGDGDTAGTDLTDAQAAAMLLDDTILPATIRLPGGMSQPFTLSGDEALEACRALKGTVLRQEIYALDGTQAQGRPYSVTEQNATIEWLQPRGINRFAVFFTHARESLDLHYERTLYNVNGRKLADPRVSHTMTLAVDDFGNVLQAAAIAYGRRYANPDPLLTVSDQQTQQRILLTATENQYTHPIQQDDIYRSPLPAEVRTYELIHITPHATQPGVTNLFRFAELAGKVQAASDGQHDLPYEDSAANGATTSAPYRRLLGWTRTLYRHDDLSGPLPLGQVEPLALPFEGYALSLTPGLLASVYRRVSGTTTEALLSEQTGVPGSEGGYLRSNDLKADGRFPDSDPDDHWWVPSGQVFYSPTIGDTPAQEEANAREHFFLTRRSRNPFGASTLFTYDEYDLLLQETLDALGNRATAGTRDASGSLIRNGNDYRVLRPQLLMDANRNRAAVAFDALGMVVGTAVMGKAEENLGDTLSTFSPDLADTIIAAHLQDPLTNPQDVLQQATTRLMYDLFAYQRTRDDPQPQPPVVYTLVREMHTADLVQGQPTKVQHSFSYSDGFGREIQKKIQAEPGPVVEGGPQSQPRWVGSGWTIVNNKGKPVRQYEPFFSTTHQFEFAVQVGVSPLLFYDPVGRVVATLHPNHTYEKVVFDPWQQTTWDVNDTVLLAPKTDPDVSNYFQRLPDVDYLPTWYEQRQAGALGAQEQATAQKTSIHAQTPTRASFDTLGHAFLAIAHNRSVSNNTPVDSYYANRSILDIQGRQRVVSDARNRVVMRYDYEMSGGHIHQDSMEAGAGWILNDIAGKPIRTWDSKGHMLRCVYDVLRRRIEDYLSTSGGSEVLVSRTVYGETQPDPEEQNLRGKPYQMFDDTGVVTNGAFDFKGNLLKSSYQLAEEYKAPVDWSTVVPLEAQSYTSSTTYDALNRPVLLTSPDNTVQHPSYNEASLLESLAGNVRGAANTTNFVTNIDYNARGQRTLITYGNGASTRYEYDPHTFLITRLSTTRGPALPGDGATVANLRYIYDPIGNVTHIQDDAQQTIYFRNRLVEPSSDYTYDAIYRLIEASGREHLEQAGGGGSGLAPIALTYDDRPRMGILQPGDGNGMGRYMQQYVYDEVGNILHMQHSGTDPSSPGWTRTYTYNEQSLLETNSLSNRLSSTQLGSNPAQLSTYDLHGNMTALSHLSLLQWDYKNQLQATARQIVTTGGTPETTYYIYNNSRQRVRKVTERQAAAGQRPTRLKERIYPGSFEIYREYGGDGSTVTLERETVHVTDGTQRIALIETRTRGSDASPAQLTRYQFSNHLGTACLELDDQGQIITYEEYYPFGSTSYQAVRSQTETPKRYRYTGQERDEENSLQYHAARYYIPWLGRWLSADPAGIGDGVNLYRYAQNNPTSLRDTNGNETDEQKASRMFEEFLTQQGVNFKKEVPFRVEVNGKWIEGRADFFVQTSSGAWQPVEMKGKATSPWTKAQQEYLPALQSGARFETIGTNKFSATVTGSGGGKVFDVQTVAQGKFEFQKLFTSSYIRRPGGDPAKGEKITLVKDASGTIVDKSVEPYTHTGTRSSSGGSELQAHEPHIREPHISEPHVKVKGKGWILGAIVALGTLAMTGDAYAAGQSVNPAANTTDAVVEKKGVGGVAWGAAKDAFYLTPPGLIVSAEETAWDLNQAAMKASHFPVPPGWVEQKAAEGRNPFCAICHGPGGALDPNNSWNHRKDFATTFGAAPPFASMTEVQQKALLEYIHSLK